MTPQEAKGILLLFRPGSADAADPQMAEALEWTRRDAELASWFEQHCAYQRAMRAKFREIEVSRALPPALRAKTRIILPPVWWRQPVWLAAAAACVVLLGAAVWWRTPRAPERFANYRARMVSTALREYRMDIVTSDMRKVRQFLASQGGPADYDLTPGLAKLALTGGGILRWQSHPVSMVCFNRGDNQMLFLFVVDRAGLADAPPETPQISTVSDLAAASWSRGNKTYVLAGPEEKDFARKYL